MFHPQATLTENVRTEAAIIAPGRYIDIDEKIYEPQPAIDSNIYQADIQYRGIDYSREAQLPHETIPEVSLKQNYGTYLYNQITSTNGPSFR